jgi:hypothetical protein
MTDFSLQDFYLFVRLAESLSIAAVARERNEHPSQVSRTLSKMEAECGLRLFHRSTHGLSLTDDGRIFLEHARTISQHASILADDLASRSNRVSGLVRISVACILAEYVVIPNLRELADHHPDLNVRQRERKGVHCRWCFSNCGYRRNARTTQRQYYKQVTQKPVSRRVVVVDFHRSHSHVKRFPKVPRSPLVSSGLLGSRRDYHRVRLVRKAGEVQFGIAERAWCTQAI